MEVKEKIFQNKRNKQLLIVLSKKRLSFLNGKVPKFLKRRLTEEDFEF